MNHLGKSHSVKSKIQLVVFDLDGTLVDTRAQISQATQITRSHLGLELASSRSLRDWFGMSPNLFFSELDGWELEDAVQAFRVTLLELSLEVDIFPEVAGVLEALKGEKVVTAIATTKPSWLAEKVVSRAGLSDLIDFVQGTDEFPPKPDPAVFLACLSQSGSSAGLSSFAVGDRIEDAIAGKASGLQAIGLRRHELDPPEDKYLLAGATCVVEDLNQALEKIGMRR